MFGVPRKPSTCAAAAAASLSFQLAEYRVRFYPVRGRGKLRFTGTPNEAPARAVSDLRRRHDISDERARGPTREHSRTSQALRIVRRAFCSVVVGSIR